MRNPGEIELLRQLLQAETAIDLNILLKQTGIGSGELTEIVKSLKQCGFLFNQTEKRISILKEPEALIPEVILPRLQTKTIGRDVLVFRETSSTNDRARQAGLAGAAEGLVIFAEGQTAGRGTRGRRWVSMAGNGLWFSILLRTHIQHDQSAQLVRMAAVTCAEAVEKWVGQIVRIKPPNDLVLGGGKLAGFLLETSNTWDFQVLGIGLNVRSAPFIDGYPTAAIEQFTRSRVSRAILASDFLNRFEYWYFKGPCAELSTAFDGRAQKPPHREIPVL
jgi:BirA family transcriptional regulator, biotin operon repressor / biotin---[acetyl-CoA-carboxylase] ligase